MILEDTVSVFVGALKKKMAKKVVFAVSYSMYTSEQKTVKNLFLLCYLIDTYFGLVLAKFEVTAAIFERA